MLYSRFGIVLVVLVAQAAAERCTTPNNEQGECMSHASGGNCNERECIHRTCAQIKLWRFCSRSHVEMTTRTIYCQTDVTVDTNIQTITIMLIVSSIGIDELPWFAALLYEYKPIFRTAQKVINCGGSLINSRYVLTAGSCVRELHTDYKFIGVRLGEHNVKTEKDCIKNQYNECSDPPEEFDVEKVIVHPLFGPFADRINIALLRLNKTVTYSDFIRPICLPTPGTKFAKIGDTLTTTGWGKLTFHSDDATDRKKKFFMKLISNDECIAARSYYSKFIVTENHACTEQLNTSLEGSCAGDAGAPVMFSFRAQWHQEGIVSYSTLCSYAPYIHMKVANHLDWIQNNIEP